MSNSHQFHFTNIFKCKHYSILLVFLFSFIIANSQSVNKDVTVTASGSGKTLEEAKQSALRSATEQAFGAFISSKTEMFNDQVVADQMASVSSGNIKSYELLNEGQFPDGRWGVTIKAIVSVDKLTSFVQSKGISVEIKGGMFALNIEQQLLNEQGEIQAIAEMVGLLHEPMQVSFDYEIKSGDPKSLDAESKNWSIPIMVTGKGNKNIDFCANYFSKTLSALSLKSAEVKSYESVGKKVFPIKVDYQGNSVTYYLRKQNSIDLINSLISNWGFYLSLFLIEAGKDYTASFEDYDGNALIFSENENSISFPTSGEVVATFSWNDKMNLSQIKQMTGYTVKPKGVVHEFKHGGYVIYEKDGHGLVATICDLRKMNWNDAVKACDELILNGYNDWRLPNKKEFEYLKSTLYDNGISDFHDEDNSSERYWSNFRDKLSNYAGTFRFNTYEYMEWEQFDRSVKFYVRAVRAF